MDKIAFGKRVSMVRHMSGMTVQELADEIGVCLTQIYQIQRGDGIPSLPCLVKLCNTFGVCPSYFLQDSLVIDVDSRYKDLNQYFKLLSPEQYKMVKTMVKSLVDEEQTTIV